VAIFEAVSQQEEQCPDDYEFCMEPTIPKHAWDFLAQDHDVAAGVNHISATYYSLQDGHATYQHSGTKLRLRDVIVGVNGEKVCKS